MNDWFVKLSKFLSFILRHHPEKYNIKLDDEGYANLKKVLIVLNNRFKSQEITINILEEMIKKSGKKRFEIRNNKIRAYYGHSFEKKIEIPKLKENEYPKELYHGTTEKAFRKIKNEGIKKKDRQYVHLSKDIKTAIKVGKRRTKNPLILKIDMDGAKKEEVNFYKSGDVFLADYIPAQCISLLFEKVED